MSNFNIILFLLAIISALIINYHIMVFILAFNAIYFLYSSPPLKLKKFPIVNPFLVALNSLIVVMIGFFTVMPFAQLREFPAKMAFLIIIFYTLIANIKDIKDVESDKKTGIKTLPVIFGEEKGKFICGVLFFIAFLAIPIFLGKMFLLVPAAIIGILGFFFVIKDKKIIPWLHE